MRKIALLTAAALFAATTAAAQQPPGLPTPDPAAAAAMAEAQARFNALPDTPGTGPYPAIKEVVRALPNNTVYRPANLAAVEPGSLGVVAWGNGGCSPDGASARQHLAEIASHGYVVVAAGPILSGPGVPARAPGSPEPARTTSAQVMAGLDWALAENVREGSPLFGLIDPKQVAVSGFSCGGVQAIDLASDPRVTAVVLHNTGLFPAGPALLPEMKSDKAWLDELHTPVLYIEGGPTDIAIENGMDDYARINHVPVAMLNQDTGHGGNFMDVNGGAAAQAAVSWLAWQLRGDTEAARLFTGPNCGMCVSTHWDYMSKNMD